MMDIFAVRNGCEMLIDIGLKTSKDASSKKV
jgi:hypothetical protein